MGRSTGIAIQHIQPGKLQQNVSIPSLTGDGLQSPKGKRCNRTVRHAWLDKYMFATIKEVQDHATDWIWIYNNDRPKMGLGGITPA